MSTDQRFDTDPHLEDALRDLYQRHESLADVESPWRLVGGAYERMDSAYALDTPARARPSWAWVLVPLAAAVSVAALVVGGSILNRSSSLTTAASDSSSSTVLDPSADSASAQGATGEDAANEARRQEEQRQEERRVQRELELVVQERTEAEERRLQTQGTANASALAQRVLEAYESRRTSGTDRPALRGYSWLQPVVAGTVQDEGHALSLSTARAEADTESCGMVYGVSAAESAHAVVVAAFAVTPLVRSDGSCSPPTESARFVEARLVTPIGDRVIIDAATGILLEPPLIIDQGPIDNRP